MKPRVVLAGGTGFLGQALARALLGKGYEVVVLSRGASRESNGIRQLHWDGKTLGAWADAIDGAQAIVNLTGRSVNCRHTPEHRREIMDSRVDSVRVLGEAVARCRSRRKSLSRRALSQSMAIRAIAGVMRTRLTPTDFSEEVCKRWEAEFEKIDSPGLRKVVMRIGIVLDADKGALPGSGAADSFFSRRPRWQRPPIHKLDSRRRSDAECSWKRSSASDLSGVFNATGPNPVTNAEFMRELRRAFHRPWSPPVPAWATRIGAFFMRTEPSLALTGRRCRPKRFLESGFHFEFPDLRRALADLCP